MAKTKLGNVKGPQGEQGVRGSKWYNTDKITGESTSGTAFPESGIADAMVGDMALNPTTLNLYTCQTAGNAATAKWVFMACIKGPQGPAGPKGDPTTVDAALSESSANPIQNKAVATKFKDVQDSLAQVFDDMSEGNDGVSDLNSLSCGIWSFDTGAKNSPCEKGIAICLTSNAWRVQLAFAVYSSRAYVRSKGVSEWSAWAQL